jgi:anti-sigma28 factor (negative regulator of flagellin synthesis)
MDESRTMKMHLLQERIERDEYEVDPRAVADAIVERLLNARSLTSDPTPRSS